MPDAQEALRHRQALPGVLDPRQDTLNGRLSWRGCTPSKTPILVNYLFFDILDI